MNRTDVDLHVHTVTSGCGYTTHRQVLELARAAGRGVIAVTDHDSAAGGLAVRELAQRSGDDLLVLVGMELTTSDLGHVVVFGRGVEEDWGWAPHCPFPRRIPDHWLAIQAHPYRNKVVQTAAGVEAAALPPLPERIDAVEVWNGGDLIKRVPHLRREMDAISRAYADREGKTAVASSDSHRPFWLHSFFTRCARPLYSVDDLVAQVRAGEVTPGAAGPAEQAWYLQAWRRRQVVEWAEAGCDWASLSAAAGYPAQEAREAVLTFRGVQSLSREGADAGTIAGATGLGLSVVADYLAIVAEEAHSASRGR
jgi:PHP-associated